ncbi:uncharacterized protein Z518_06575 [Rhinocladiella mackenziei CBS 650.93]|uniref:Rhinocladiella mackenziei CBS 650.93 unplaced genomic scaffold supercont1.5, whole genome shotgun sequence n=1 Tax=Rhinocladiella mackenziei CBS 650.93 TaxID=1442369 RepID=A0A0D2J2B0_9EURO|nr:uncharacterized protein Z518_06575 [Rhinocladiella mackenziei CBS 650.93]KIX03025.1 hypothetical protein Z518_06575 [Rhinocladiella mackenziei CBS 650.93]
MAGDEATNVELNSLSTIEDVEATAMHLLSPKALAYYASATDDEITKAANHRIYQQIFLRPRALRDRQTPDLSTSFLGHRIGIPIYVSPAAMARLAHSDGEAGIAAACSSFDALQIISHNASMTPTDIVRAGKPGQIFGWQLYVLKDLPRTESILARIRQIPEIKFLVLTLDAPFPGKRETDEQFKMREVVAGVPPPVWGTEAGLTWEKTLKWLTQHTSLPIVLKGIQTHEDACMATRYPCVKGIILSNHGGRALDTAPTPVQLLMEIQKFCPEVLQHLDVLVDGGIKRGTDVVKALALGAKAAGIGRLPLYGLAVGGQNGVEKTLEILADETKAAMTLLGVRRVRDLNMSHINARALESILYDGPAGTMYDVERQLSKI